MSLFQRSVIKKYTQDLNKEHLDIAWQLFRSQFHDPAIQQNIMNLKEEEYQEGFMRDLFVKVLGYTLNPQPDFNLVLEKKSVTDATKSDGAILKAGEVTAVIELKDTSTADLGKVVKQAFGYKYQHKDCVYVITANFEKLRLYINDAIEFEEFDLFRLTKEHFALLFCCLQQKAFENDVPLKMKQQSVAEEENITKKLYSEYSGFKKQLFANIKEQNPEYNKLELYKKTQKLLDRFLFLLFAEDRLLVPPNSVREIIQGWEKLKELDNYVPLYDRFKKYFGYLNTGYQRDQYEIFGYNGGLFAPDEILDNITIDDTLLFNSCKGLSNYDFESEVDVNILGHIFEHSLTEIEEVQRELTSHEGGGTEGVSKRKKDGVFYTPRYITKYIVENTIGTLCTEKKVEFKIVDEDFTPQKRKANRKQLLQKIEDYRDWLLQITICDPACGSGAFLNQALEFLIAEHRIIDELKAKLFGDTLILSDVETSILENNLYGVDINEEAVEIAKLSLWLHTARKGRKLNNLSKHIRCGNSLIDDPKIAGDKAFNWQEQFTEVFSKGGFDIVLGNPPYALMQPNNTSKSDLDYFKSRFEFADFKIDLFHLFFQLGHSITKKKGLLSYIAPSTLLYNYFVDKLRKWLTDNSEIKLLAVSLEKVFADADVHTAIYILKKSLPIINQQQVKLSIDLEGVINGKEDYHTIEQRYLNETPGNVWNLLINSNNIHLLKKISNHKSLIELAKVNRGLITGDRSKYFTKLKDTEKHIKILTGSDIGRFYFNEPEEYVLFERPKTAGGSWDKEVHLAPHKICVRQIGFQPTASFVNMPYAVTGNVFTVITGSENSEKYIVTILNSRVIKYYWQIMFNDFKSTFPQVTIFSLGQVPIPEITDEEKLDFISQADIMFAKNFDLQQLKNGFLKLLIEKYEVLTLNNKLQDWLTLSFKEFLKELDKQKIKLTLPEQAEWMQYFESEKSKANAIQQAIRQTDKEIDDMVYKLYGLTDDEKKIVEQA